MGTDVLIGFGVGVEGESHMQVESQHAMRPARGKLDGVTAVIQVLGFDLTSAPVAVSVVPTIDGIRLTEIVHDFELSKGYLPAGAYGGLIPWFFNFGPLDQHYEGRGFCAPQAVVLGCECGEWGCWPLLASVTADAGSVTWSEFSQSHRPGWDYEAMGTFRFDRLQFDSAVQDLIRRLPNASEDERP
jgi:hypothetical protein